MVSLCGRGFDSLQLHFVTLMSLALVRVLRPEGQSDFVDDNSLQLHKCILKISILQENLPPKPPPY